MLLQTKNFGEIEVEESKIVTFEGGIPGFRDLKSFVLLSAENDMASEPGGTPEERNAFSWLQSVDDGDIAFVLMDVFVYMPDYNPLIDDEELEDLGEFKQEDFIVLNITVIPENINKLSVNLKAPVIINTATKRGKQIIASNEEYSIRYRLFEELEKKA